MINMANIIFMTRQVLSGTDLFRSCPTNETQWDALGIEGSSCILALQRIIVDPSPRAPRYTPATSLYFSSSREDRRGGYL